MRFLLDMGITPRAIRLLREYGHEGYRCSEFGMATALDEDLVHFAKATDLVIIATDKRFADILVLSGVEEPGVIILRLDNPSFDEMLSGIRRVLETYSEEQMYRSVIVVEHNKTRRHRLGRG